MPTGRSLSKLGHDTGQHETTDGTAGETSLGKCNLYDWVGLGGGAMAYFHETKMGQFIVGEGEITPGTYWYTDESNDWEEYAGTYDDDDEPKYFDPLKVLESAASGIANSRYGWSLMKKDHPETDANVYERNFGETDFYNTDTFAISHADEQHTGHTLTRGSITHTAAWVCTAIETGIFTSDEKFRAGYIGKYNQYDKDTGIEITDWAVAQYKTCTTQE
tara:strand:- start:149 stop:805 length:657 start_codon:yes stop_codon:yes gene_type:complete